jgi:hypothetical protein
MKFLELLKKSDRLSPPAPSLKAWLRIESLESRVVPYVTTGSAWLPYTLNGTTYYLTSQKITVSFIPDGTLMTVVNGVNVYSNLFATFNKKWNQSTWQNEILNAAQLWAQQANLNLSVVSDNGAASGAGNYQQGDPGVGDIRIGGYNFGNSTYLAGAYQPPSANTYSIAGDININTGINFNIGSSYDLQTVMIHEFGHALGLGHSSVTSANMYPSYQTIRRALASDDVGGIQAIYGARKADAYGGNNNSFATAVDITSQLDPNALAAVVNNLDLTSTTPTEYFTVTAPAATSGAFTVTVQSAGLSLLRPSVTVYAADQVTVLGSASDTGYTGSTLSVPITGFNPGDQFYIQVTGADTTQFAAGNFALSVNFGSGLMPAVAQPVTQVSNAATLTSGGTVGLVGMALETTTNTVSNTTSLLFGGRTPPGLDFMAISDQYVPLACRMHGSGCGCPACAGAAKMQTQQTTTVARWTMPDLALIGAANSQGNSKTPDGSNPSPDFAAFATAAQDAFFMSYGNTLPDPTKMGGGG